MKIVRKNNRKQSTAKNPSLTVEAALLLQSHTTEFQTSRFTNRKAPMRAQNARGGGALQTGNCLSRTENSNFRLPYDEVIKIDDKEVNKWNFE